MPDGDGKAINNHQHPPQTITLDGYARPTARTRAERRRLAADAALVDTLEYLIEQDHGSVKHRIAVMLV
jgi:hypothetical protein